MKDYLPLIIILLISLIGTLGRKKKRTDQENISQQRPEMNRDNDFLSWIEKLENGEDEIVKPFFDQTADKKPVEAPVAPQREVVAEPAKEEVNNIFSKYSGFISPEEKEKMIATEGNSSLHPDKDNLSEATDSPLTEQEKKKEKQPLDFDLRRAVIFSEILNRKYV